ncbi:hypothetical protein GCM10023320_81440 [Pseudonocardia adelaidensis]|uniref:Uncharacterized protein n=1 Tax=Pseudonocardia adelaidensis TaxID=648754 RepID=A0ABP9P7Y3_9PSEU
MGEQPGSTPSSPATGLPLKLSSATITADGSRYLDLEPDHLLQLKLSISARVLGGFDILLATTDKSRESAADSSENIPGTERLELHINSILLSSLPRLIHLSGRSLAAHHDDAAPRSYTLTLIFSAGSDTAMFWSTTFDVPRSPLVDSRWHLTVPFSHSLTPAGPPHTP